MPIIFKRPIVKKNLFFITFLSTFLFADNFENFLTQQKQSFNTYKTTVNEEFKSYKKAYDKGIEEYKKEIKAYWPNIEISSEHQFVQYDKEYQSKKLVDFKNEFIQLEVIANNEQEARDKLLASWNDLMQEDVQEGYKKDQLETKINQELHIQPLVESNEKIIGDVLSSNEQQEFITILQTKPLEKIEHQNRTIYKLNLKLPSNAMVKKAQLYQPTVEEYSQETHIPKELIYAVIHSESSFNPMARSAVPAFGLMQIVPKSAGIDTYHFLYGEKKLLSSNYLYNPTNNIKIGSTYLHILNSKYLSEIENDESRLYCTIAAYNTGAGNVARTFVGSNNVTQASRKINAMTPQNVYKHLMRNLPYMETKDYLHRVNERRFIYLNLIQSNTL